MKSVLLPFAFSVLAGPALALSCIRPDVANSFNEAAASDKTYVVVLGTLDFDEGKLPDMTAEQQDQAPPHVDIPARLSGKALSHDGFRTDFDRSVTLRAMCFGPWCGRAVSGTQYLSFLEKTDDGYVLSVTPCGGFEFANPTEEMLEKTRQCFRGAACTPDPM